MDASTFPNNAVPKEDHLHFLLKQYELSAHNCLGGINGILNHQIMEKPTFSVSNALANFVMHRDQQTTNEISTNSGSYVNGLPVHSFPILTQTDRTTTLERQETVLEGECIACFAVGGEKRLCLPQILGSVLRNYSTMDVNRARIDLNIHCNQCTSEQLISLKTTGVLAASCTSCSLITKTDAERLCNYLLRQLKQDPEQPRLHASMNGRQKASTGTKADHSPHVSSTSNDDDVNIPVLHMCFGRCRGKYHPGLYCSPSAECIECDECKEFLAPDRFVVHSHRNQERRTCHWGFDSANWRAYIHSPFDQANVMYGENKKILDEMKLRFDVTGLLKRPLDEYAANSNDTDKQDVAAQKKRFKSSSTDCNKITAPAPPTAMSMDQQLPYLFCDPVFLVAYYQTLLSTATVSPQQQQAAIFTPSLLHPQRMAKMDYHRQLQQPQSFCQQQLRFPNATTTADEATAAAALKLLQLRECTNDKGVGNTVFQTSPAEGAGEKSKISGTIHQAESGQMFSNNQPFKKHLLHLFAVEQQQKEYLDLQQKHEHDHGRASVEVIVDDDRKLTIDESVVSGRVSTETQCADEQNSDDSTQSLDDLLKRYVHEEHGRMAVKSKIAENQRFMEQKLDALVRENRSLREECVQLRMKQQLRAQQLNGNAMNFLGLMPKPVIL